MFLQESRGNIMKVLNLFGKSVVSIATLAVFGAAFAAGRDDPRGNQNPQSGRSTMSARMPTIPTVGLNTIGNPAVHVVTAPVEAGMPHIVPTPTPDPDPDPNPDPDPDPECPDGGVRNSAYTIKMCMDSILQCINTGALPGGINDLFCNDDVRNSVMNGMHLCQAEVERCIAEVRVDCRNIYAQSSDVWLDFNSRVIQPQYYNFVLRKTGLTPNQAENTCLLLDRNTYGSSFAAVSDVNAVNSEYDNRVGAYNGARAGMLSKDNPQGDVVNTVGYSGNRGHYARWDGCKAECLVRVAAYNKDELIKNSWLFGAVGNDNPAEVWQRAGSSFTCNKDLFDFSLLNNTKTTAVVAVGGGTALGTAIGAGVGAHNYNEKHQAYLDSVDAKNDPCTDEKYRKELGAKIYASGQAGVLKSYAYKNVMFSGNGDVKTFTGTPIFSDGYNFNEMDEDHCRDLHQLEEKVVLYDSLVRQCLSNPQNVQISNSVSSKIGGDTKTVVGGNIVLSQDGNTLVIGQNIQCGAPGGTTQSSVETFNRQCMFVPLQVQTYMAGNSGILCSHNNNCLTVAQIQYQINELQKLLSVLNIKQDVVKDANKGAEIAKGALVGGATGAGVGGIVTGITALVERSNITCRVGDGLNSVALGKTHTIDSLKDFYVKWNLRLPETVSPTSAVSDMASWQQACSQFNNRLNDCPNVQINLIQGNSYELVQSACVVSGSICIVNAAVAQSHGIE